LARLDSLGHLMDSLDERSIHELRGLEKKSEEVLSRLQDIETTLRESLSQSLEEERRERTKNQKELEESIEKAQNEFN